MSEGGMMQENRIYPETILYAIYAALIPLNMILNFSGNGTINKYIGLLAAAIGVYRLLVTRKIALPSMYYIFIIFAAYCFIAVLIAPETQIHFFQTYISLLATFLVFSIRGFNKKEFNFIMFLSTVVAAIVFFYLAPNLGTSYSRGTLSSEAGSADSNSLAANMLFSAVYSIDKMFSGSNNKQKVLYATLLLLIVLGVVMTGSRGALLTLAISSTMYYVHRNKRKDKQSSKVLNYCLIILAVLVAGRYISGHVNSHIIERLNFTSLIEDGGSGRLEIWKYYLKESHDSIAHLLFGHGFATSLNAHNVYIEYLYSTGIIGCVLLIVSQIVPLKYAIRSKSSLSVGYLIIIIATCCTIGYFLNKGYWNGITLAMIAINNMDRKEDNSCQDS